MTAYNATAITNGDRWDLELSDFATFDLTAACESAGWWHDYLAETQSEVRVLVVDTAGRVVHDTAPWLAEDDEDEEEES